MEEKKESSIGGSEVAAKGVKFSFTNKSKKVNVTGLKGNTKSNAISLKRCSNSSVNDAGNNNQQQAQKGTETSLIFGEPDVDKGKEGTKKRLKLKPIPLIKENKWYGGGASERSVEDEEAANALIGELNGNHNKSTNPGAETKLLLADEANSIPLLLKNKAPIADTEKDTKKGLEMDVGLRPNDPSFDTYDAMPVEAFGTLLLRGMGWKEGEALNDNKNALIEPLLNVKRYGRRGLGANSTIDDQDIEDLLGKNKRDRKNKAMVADKVKSAGAGATRSPRGPVSEKLVEAGIGNKEKDVTIKLHSSVLIVSGSHKGMYGHVRGIDSSSSSSNNDECTVCVNLIVNDKDVTVHIHDVSLCDEKDVVRSKRHLNTPLDVLKRINQSKDQDKGAGGNDGIEKKGNDKTRTTQAMKDDEESNSQSHDNVKTIKSSIGNIGSSSSSCSRARESVSWLHEKILVRMISKRYKGGKYYNSKIRIESIVSPYVCVCTDDYGKFLDAVTQDMLETVVPKREGSHVMVVKGKYKRSRGVLIQRDSKMSFGIIQLSNDAETVVKLYFDDFCSYLS